MTAKNKKILSISAIAGLAVLLVLMAIVSHTPTPNCNNHEFAGYVSAYTEGPISKGGTIKVVLNSALADSIDRQKIDANELITVYPKINGSTKFLDERTIEFSPERPFISGKKYTVKFRLYKIADVKRSIKSLIFPVQVIAQDLKVNIDEQTTTDLKTLKYQQITGSVKTADIESMDGVKRAVSAFIGKTEYNIKWRETELGDIFNFTIDSVERTEEPRTLSIKYNGQIIGSSTTGEKKLTIPPINEFAVSSIKVINTPTQHIRIQFTDPLKEPQNLDGLVTVGDNSPVSGESDYTIEASGNCINLYPSSYRKGKANIFLAAGIKNVLGYNLSGDMNFEISYEMQKPQLKSVKTGLILPDGENGLVYPFEAINLTAVDVTIIKVLEHNILSYIRDYSDYYNTENLQQTGVPVFRKTIHINDRESEDATEWKRYYLELSRLIKPEPGAIYNIKIAFRKSHAIFDCDSCNGGDDVSMEKDIDISDFDNWKGYYDSFDKFYYESAGYNWRNSENPCYKMYYQSDKFLDQNILASNIGLIAKKGADESLVVYTTDLKTANPLLDVDVELYGYQQQLLAKKRSNQDGSVDFGPQPKGYFVVAKRGNEFNYLKIQDGNSLSMSKFDISGSIVQNGLKGFIYGERGVWRPGDSIHLSFVLNENLKEPLPNGYPITLEVRNPLSQQVYKETQNKKNGNFYVFNFKTADDAISGNYEATVTCGNSHFYKNLIVENVLPNRLKINTSFNKETLTTGNNAMTISSQWLHGAPARNLKVDVSMQLTATELAFPEWKDYHFGNDKLPQYTSSESIEVFSGQLNEYGKTTFHPTFNNQYSNYPAKMKARYRVQVYEKSGRFSKDETSIEVMPYKNYIGIKMPDNDGRFLYVDQPQTVDIVVTDNKGKAVSDTRNLTVKLYQLDWQWWYDSHNYVSEYNSTLIDERKISAKGKGQYTFMVKYPNWGRFMIDVTDTKTGISSSKIFYMDWPDSFGRSPILSQGSTVLELASDKTKYTVGDKATISIPGSSNGHALVTIENGTKVLHSAWIYTRDGKTEYKFKIEPDMEPGVYVYVTLLQPHSQTVNDIPIRMYGVLPLDIENPDTRLEPEISMPDVIQAEQEVKVTVSEKNNKNMTYTIALVDDGLLDLTHYKTPDPWKQFYSREALGVKTIDMFDNVIGAFGGKIEKMFSIGGDDASEAPSAGKANNFESVAAFMGPFSTNGGRITHTFKMPKYVGSVRTMVVAGNGKAYGKAEKTCTVTKPLMIFATTPRIIGTNEKFKLPVTVFTGHDNISNVSVKIKAANGLKVSGESSQTVSFSGKGEQNTTFEIESGNDKGTGTIEITATSGNHASTMELRLDIRQPNTLQSQTVNKAVQPGETATIALNPLGRPGTNTASLCISGILPVNYDGHIARLMAYPYENLENIICKAFPMIYAPAITETKSQAKEHGENLIRETIKKVYEYQTSFGGLSYFKSENYTNVWLTSLAGHFMIEAQKAGYSVNPEFMDKWRKFQKIKAESWTPDSEYSYTEQAYRLYTLALYGEALNGQMNRLKEQPDLPADARMYLGAAYTKAGKKSIGESLLMPIALPETDPTPMMLIALCDLGQQESAFREASKITKLISGNTHWLACEYESMALVALGKYFEKYKPSSDINCAYSWNGHSEEIKTEKTFASKTLEITGADKQSLTFTNNTDGILYVEITNKGIPEAGKEEAGCSGLTIKHRYYQGDTEISPLNLKQGEDFTSKITITNNSGNAYSNLAITEMFPSGWEILSSSVLSYNSNDYEDYSEYKRQGKVKYTDTRDDRKHTYFYLPAQGSITFKTDLTATYAGQYYLPGIICEDIDHPYVFAKTKGATVEVEPDQN